MGLLEKVRPLFRPPVVEITAYECAECNAPLDGPAAECPECGGEVTEIVDELVPTYWH